MNFWQVWFNAYTSPARFVSGIKETPGLRWGLCALVLRSLMVSLLIYVPAAIMGGVPEPPSFIPFILSTEVYYWHLTWVTPLVFTIQWLLGGIIIYHALKLMNHRTKITQILNLIAMASLAVGVLLTIFDWLILLLGGMNQVSMGMSHLAIDIWWFALILAGLRNLDDVPVGRGLIATFAAFLATMPLPIFFMRAPW